MIVGALIVFALAALSCLWRGRATVAQRIGWAVLAVGGVIAVIAGDRKSVV